MKNNPITLRQCHERGGKMQTVMRDPMSDFFGVELKMYSYTHVSVDGEIEGCWQSPKYKSYCRLCGSRLVKVPRQGHRNSAFWVNERPDGQILIACPKMCLESKAVEAMGYFLEHRQFMKDGSKSYGWEWDYNKFENGWILPDGRFVFCARLEHIGVAHDYLPEDKYTAEDAGFVKFSYGTFYWGIPLNQRQKDILFDISVGRGRKLSQSDYHQMESDVGQIDI